MRCRQTIAAFIKISMCPDTRQAVYFFFYKYSTRYHKDNIPFLFSSYTHDRRCSLNFRYNFRLQTFPFFFYFRAVACYPCPQHIEFNIIVSGLSVKRYKKFHTAIFPYCFVYANISCLNKLFFHTIMNEYPSVIMGNLKAYLRFIGKRCPVYVGYRIPRQCFYLFA